MEARGTTVFSQGWLFRGEIDHFDGLINALSAYHIEGIMLMPEKKTIYK